jgi:CheY-like chemotaxis protein
MPVKDGWETLGEIKNTPELRDIPIIIWTTSSEDGDRSRSIEMGANAFITKPGTYAHLLSSIRSLLDEYCDGE